MAIDFGCWSTGKVTDEMVNDYLEHPINPNKTNRLLVDFGYMYIILYTCSQNEIHMLIGRENEISILNKKLNSF